MRRWFFWWDVCYQLYYPDIHAQRRFLLHDHVVQRSCGSLPPSGAPLSPSWIKKRLSVIAFIYSSMGYVLGMDQKVRSRAGSLRDTELCAPVSIYSLIFISN